MDDIDYNDISVKQIVEDFDRRQSCAKWFWHVSGDGDFDLLNKKEILQKYIDMRLQQLDGNLYIQEYFPANTYSEAKKEIISRLSYAARELRSCLRRAKGITKGNRE